MIIEVQRGAFMVYYLNHHPLGIEITGEYFPDDGGNATNTQDKDLFYTYESNDLLFVQHCSHLLP